LNVHASTTPTDNVPTFTRDRLYNATKIWRYKLGYIFNIADVTGLADVLVGNYGNVKFMTQKIIGMVGNPNYRYFYESNNGKLQLIMIILRT
jgi:hypothetical protein